jgi:hypothetical protein
MEGDESPAPVLLWELGSRIEFKVVGGPMGREVDKGALHAGAPAGQRSAAVALIVP